MRTEPELLNERLERLAIVLDEIMPNAANLVRDALELLKEKEAVKPTIYECGSAYCSCGEKVGIITDYDDMAVVRMNYCPDCGKKMIWSDTEKKRRARNWYE